MRFHLLAAPLLTYCISAQTVTITNGTIRGGVCPSLEAAFYHSIPYARPPIGSLRFSAPQPYDQKFNSTLDGTKTAPSCIQFGKLFIEHGAQSEDCLFLNVWVPRNATNSSSLPVKVFIYGGSNLAGGISDPMYDGCNAATDSIIVSINYRLGPLGFLGIETAGFTGNYAVQDLLLGLRWVHENIKAFGGDSVSINFSVGSSTVLTCCRKKCCCLANPLEQPYLTPLVPSLKLLPLSMLLRPNQGEAAGLYRMRKHSLTFSNL